MGKKNQRASERVLHSVVALIKIGDNPPVPVKTLDLSKGGALLDSPMEASLGERVFVTFKVGSTELNPTAAYVRRVAPAFGGRRHCIALEFAAPNFQLMELIKRDLKAQQIQLEVERLGSSWGENPIQ